MTPEEKEKVFDQKREKLAREYATQFESTCSFDAGLKFNQRDKRILEIMFESAFLQGALASLEKSSEFDISKL